MEAAHKRPVVIIDDSTTTAQSEHIHVDLLIKKLARVDNLPLKIILWVVGETLESLFRAHLPLPIIFHTIKLDRLDLARRTNLLKSLETLSLIDVTTGWRSTRIAMAFPTSYTCSVIRFSGHSNECDQQWLARLSSGTLPSVIVLLCNQPSEELEGIHDASGSTKNA